MKEWIDSETLLLRGSMSSCYRQAAVGTGDAPNGRRGMADAVLDQSKSFIVAGNQPPVSPSNAPGRPTVPNMGGFESFSFGSKQLPGTRYPVPGTLFCRQNRQQFSFASLPWTERQSCLYHSILEEQSVEIIWQLLPCWPCFPLCHSSGSPREVCCSARSCSLSIPFLPLPDSCPSLVCLSSLDCPRLTTIINDSWRVKKDKKPT